MLIVTAMDREEQEVGTGWVMDGGVSYHTDPNGEICELSRAEVQLLRG